MYIPSQRQRDALALPVVKLASAIHLFLVTLYANDYLSIQASNSRHWSRLVWIETLFVWQE